MESSIGDATANGGPTAGSPFAASWLADYEVSRIFLFFYYFYLVLLLNAVDQLFLDSPFGARFFLSLRFHRAVSCHFRC